MWLKLFLILPLIVGTAIVGIGLGTRTPAARPPAAGMLSAAQETPRNAEPAPELTATDLRGDPLPPGALARLGTVRLRHAHSSAGLVATFSPDGKTVVSAGDGAGKRWDTATGKLLGQLPRGQRSALLFAPNGRWLADAGGDLLDATSGEVVVRLVPRDSPYALVALAFAPDSSLLATSAPDGTVTLWNTATGKATQQLRGHEQRVGAAAFSSEGHTLITMGSDPGRDMKVCHWDLAKGELSRSVSLPITTWRTLRLSPDGRTLAVSLGAEVSLWDTTTGEQRGSLGEDAAKAYYGLAFSPDSQKLATDWYDPESGEVRICIWDVAARKLLRRFPVPPHALGFLYFSPDNRTLATSGMREPRLRLWDTMTGNPLHQQETAHDEAIQALAFTPDGKTILSGSDDGTVRVWDAGTGRGIRQLPGHAGGVTALAATPDGRAVLSAGHGAQLLLQEWQTGKELRRLILVPKEKLSTNASYGPSMSLAPDGRTAAAIVGTGGQEWFLQVRDTADGRVLTQRTDHSGKRFAAFSPDTRILATYVDTYGPVAPSNNPKAKAAGGTEVVGVQVVLEDVTTGRQLLAITLPERNGYRADFPPDGRTLVTHDYRVRNDDNGSHVDNHALHLWELVTGQERLTIRSPEEGFQYGYEKLVFSPDGRTLAAARRDHTIQAWDVATGAELLSRGGYESDVYSLVFRPDGKTLASGHRDSTILLWDLTDAARKPRTGVALTAERLEQAWADMASADARKGGAALWEMVATPERAVPLLGSRLSPAAPAPADKLRNLLVELDSDKFERREAASKQLADLGELAEPALEEALKSDPSADKRRRIERLLAAPRIVWTPEQVRAFRAVEVLERIGSVEARRSLEALAKGTPEARLTREATASLDRIARRSAASP
jgi:WD40 repeat protein